MSAARSEGRSTLPPSSGVEKATGGSRTSGAEVDIIVQSPSEELRPQIQQKRARTAHQGPLPLLFWQPPNSRWYCSEFPLRLPR